MTADGRYRTGPGTLPRWGSRVRIPSSAPRARPLTGDVGVPAYGPELRPTKTHRTHRADLDHGTRDVLRSHRARVEAQASEKGIHLAGTCSSSAPNPTARSRGTRTG